VGRLHDSLEVYSPFYSLAYRDPCKSTRGWHAIHLSLILDMRVFHFNGAVLDKGTNRSEDSFSWANSKTLYYYLLYSQIPLLSGQLEPQSFLLLWHAF